MTQAYVLTNIHAEMGPYIQLQELPGDSNPEHPRPAHLPEQNIRDIEAAPESHSRESKIVEFSEIHVLIPVIDTLPLQDNGVHFIDRLSIHYEALRAHRKYQEEREQMEREVGVVPPLWKRNLRRFGHYFLDLMAMVAFIYPVVLGILVYIKGIEILISDINLQSELRLNIMFTLAAAGFAMGTHLGSFKKDCAKIQLVSTLSWIVALGLAAAAKHHPSKENQDIDHPKSWERRITVIELASEYAIFHSCLMGLFLFLYWWNQRYGSRS